jgi:hypothetical protein
MSFTDTPISARDVADARALDLHDVGALVGQQGGGIGPGQYDRELEDAYSRKGGCGAH